MVLTVDFEFPRFPSERTIISRPFSKEDFSSEAEYKLELKKHKNVLEKVKLELVELDNANKLSETTIGQLLALAQVTEDDYYRAHEISERGTVVILKRKVDEIYINNYNPEWLKVWDGNMDLQICLD